MRPIVFCTWCLLLFGCNKSEEKRFLVSKIQSAAKLATTEVVLNKIVSYNYIDNNKGKRRFRIVNPKNRCLLFDTEATAKYGIDMRKINGESVVMNGDSITLLLPPIELISFDYPHTKMKQIYPLSKFDNRKSRHKVQDLDEAFRLAERDIINKIRILNVKEQAEIKTKNFLHQFLLKFDYDKVTIKFKSEINQ